MCVCVYQNTKIQTNMSSEEDAFHLEFSMYEIYSEHRPKERTKRQKEFSVGRSSCVIIDVVQTKYSLIPKTLLEVTWSVYVEQTAPLHSPGPVVEVVYLEMCDLGDISSMQFRSYIAEGTHSV